MLEGLSARAFLEWQAYFRGKREVERLIADHMDPGLAYRAVWDPVKDT